MEFFVWSVGLELGLFMGVFFGFGSSVIVVGGKFCVFGWVVLKNSN